MLPPLYGRWWHGVLCDDGEVAVLDLFRVPLKTDSQFSLNPCAIIDHLEWLFPLEMTEGRANCSPFCLHHLLSDSFTESLDYAQRSRFYAANAV